MFERSSPPADWRQRLLIAVGGVLGTAAVITLVFFMGAWGFAYRRYSLHDGRLRRLVEQHPFIAQVSEGLRQEPGSRELPAPRTEAELERLAGRLSPARVADVVAKKRRWPTVRVFEVAGMVYFLYFDDAGVLQDYVLDEAERVLASYVSPDGRLTYESSAHIVVGRKSDAR